MVTSIDLLHSTRLAPLTEIGHAAAGAVDRTAFLPLVARETVRMLGATACEVWLTDGGVPSVAATFRAAPASVRSPSEAGLAAALAGTPSEADGWLCTPMAGSGAVRGVLAVAGRDAWSAEDRQLAELVATMAALGLQAGEAGQFDDQARDEFLALVGHDLRSPLSNVRVGAQLARRNLSAGDLESVDQALAIIENQSGRLLSRLEALLDAVAASGRWLIRLEPLDLAAMAEAAAAPFRLAAAESQSGTTFAVDVAPGTPQARGDAGQIGQVLEHLVDNAAKYAAGGHVTVAVAPSGAMVRVDVCDDGPGIRPEDVHRVFAPFGRGRAAAGKEGYGLGLYLARNIVTAHGGRLWIARTSRSGTCMAFTLPASMPEDG
jgi:signal transduction histidine kinase